MLLLEPTQFLLPVPALALPLLLVQELLLASVLAQVLPLLALPAFSARRLSLRLALLAWLQLVLLALPLAWLLALPQP
jgi:hypothetical protein